MKRLPLTMGATAVAVSAAPAVALAQPPTAAHVHAYEHAYHQVARRLGPRVPGRNIIEDGVARSRRPTDGQTVASLHVLQRMLVPSAATPTTATATTAASTAVSTAVSSSPVTTTGAAGVPACASESGSDYSTGASNTNASSGATGRYQILPSTAAAYGCSLSTPAGQDACAQTIYEHQGAGAWVGCGG